MTCRVADAVGRALFIELLAVSFAVMLVLFLIFPKQCREVLGEAHIKIHPYL